MKRNDLHRRRRGKKKDIMRAIMQGAGAHTKAHALCFSILSAKAQDFKLIDEESKPD
jgi:hypothetical protein